MQKKQVQLPSPSVPKSLDKKRMDSVVSRSQILDFKMKERRKQNVFLHSCISFYPLFPLQEGTVQDKISHNAKTSPPIFAMEFVDTAFLLSYRMLPAKAITKLT